MLVNLPIFYLYICLLCTCICAYFVFVYLPILYLYFFCCSFVFLWPVLVSWQQYQRWKHFRAEHYLPSMPATAILPIQLPGHHVAVFCFCILYFVFCICPRCQQTQSSPYSSQAIMLLYFSPYLCLFQCNFFSLQNFQYDARHGIWLVFCQFVQMLLLVLSSDLGT